MHLRDLSHVASRYGWCPVILAAAHCAAASSFAIAPVRLELSAGHRIEALTVRNQSDTPVLIQLRAVGWSQKDQQDQFDATQALLTTPPIFEIPAQGEQIVRVALRGDVDPTRELTYRLFVEEVPRPHASTDSGLDVALRLSLPIFVSPLQPAQPHLVWSSHTEADGSVRIEANNSGTAHLQVTDFELSLASGGPTTHVGQSHYVLPGSHIAWTVTLPGRCSRRCASDDSRRERSRHVHGVNCGREPLIAAPPAMDDECRTVRRGAAPAAVFRSADAGARGAQRSRCRAEPAGVRTDGRRERRDAGADRRGVT